MTAFISQYIRIINQEARNLLDNKFEALNPIQVNVLQSILKHTEELSLEAIAIEETQRRDHVRHELLNLMTPISGYIDMLSDGWMGDFSEQQSDSIKLISLAVQRLTEHIRTFATKDNEHQSLVGA